MRLILIRHGNTFREDDPIVWAGAKQDLPLVEKGFKQALASARHLRGRDIEPAAIYCGPLRRTHRYAQVLADVLRLEALIIEPRLDEIDYGSWGGRSSEEVAEIAGPEGLRAWNERSVWPTDAGWLPGEDVLRAEAALFAQELLERHGEGEDVVAVSSNGRLRYFLTLVEGEWQRRVDAGEFKMKTGHHSELVLGRQASGLLSWNQEPSVR